MYHTPMSFFRLLAVTGLGLLLLAACGGGGGGGADTSAGYTVGGTITGLVSGASVTLETAGASPLVRSENGSFTFNQRYGSGSPYRVRVTDHTGRDIQGCHISNASGTIADANVTNVLVQCYDQVLLSAATGDTEITLRWTKLFEPNPTDIVVCTADDPDVFDGSGGCAHALDLTTLPEIEGGKRYELKDTGLTNDLKTHYYQVRFGDVYSNVAFARPREQWVRLIEPAFNDTGIIWWTDGGVNQIAAPNIDTDSYPGQDADHGRDEQPRPTKSADGFGLAAFDFTKIAGDSRDLPSDVALGIGADDWSCIRDNVTGLTWELRPNQSDHLRHRGWRYTWYSEASAINGGSSGVANGILCGETLFGCNTQRYVERVNALGLCGYTDWRLPTQAELYSILHFGRQGPAVDPMAFPDMDGGRSYWSSTPGSTNTNLVWDVRFQQGQDGLSTKQSQYAVRLVREDDTPFPLPEAREDLYQASGQTCRQEMYPTAPRSGFDIVAGGYACQKGTGLLWRSCPLGLTWDEGTSTCLPGTAHEASWQSTLDAVHAVGESGGNWRLPNIKELNSIIERRCSNPAVDTRVFPVMPAGTIWSASPVAANPASVWSAQLNATSGGDDGSGAEDLGFALIVRDDAVTCPP